MTVPRRSRGNIAAGLTALLAIAITIQAAPTAGAAPPQMAGRAPIDVDAAERAFGLQQVPKGSLSTARQSGQNANPYLSLLPDPSQVDIAGWKAQMAAAGKVREHARHRPHSPLVVQEREATNAHTNDTDAGAEFISAFGTGRRENPAATISGNLDAPQAPLILPTPREDNGAIPLATDLRLSSAEATQVDARIGDGPHGSGGTGTGDFDYYRIDGQAGDFVTAQISTPAAGALDTVLILWSADGIPLLLNDDFGLNRDSVLMGRLPADGPYFLSVAGFPDAFPGDPFDPASGSGGGSEGRYRLSATTGADIDSFAIELEPGDVVGASVVGAGGQLDLADPAGTLVIGSSQDASYIYPASTPLPGGGNAVLAHVADTRGKHVLRVLGIPGSYQITLEVYRAGGETTRRTQTIFLDFDGARLNTNIFGGPGVRTLSPMSSFLPNWGLSSRDERAVIRAIEAEVKENLSTDPRLVNRRASVEILNSRDDRDPGNRPGVSRIIVGGTIAESGIPTIGVAQSIDPGNFETAETALVLLDVMSAPIGQVQFPGTSLNEYITPASNRVAFVGQAVGNVVSHEAGHYLGSFHVDQFNANANLMDQGGNPALMYAVGPDEVGGTADDPDVDFGVDIFNPGEGFTGIEDTLTTTAFGLTRR